MTTVGELFEREPIQWGLRGDPHLWRAMRVAFADVELPSSAAELRRLIEDQYRSLVGDHMDGRGEQNVHVAAFRIGSGMSDGTVHRDFWELTVVPLITDRWMTARDTP